MLLDFQSVFLCAAGAGEAGPAGAGCCGAAAERGAEGSTVQQPGDATVGGSTEQQNHCYYREQLQSHICRIT